MKSTVQLLNGKLITDFTNQFNNTILKRKVKEDYCFNLYLTIGSPFIFKLISFTSQTHVLLWQNVC